MQRGISVLLAMILQIGAGWLGRRIYPCERMRWVILLCVLLEGLAAAAAMVMHRRSGLPKKVKNEQRALVWEERLIWLAWLGMLANTLILGAATGAVCETMHAVVNAAIGAVLAAPLAMFLLCWPSTVQPHGRKNELRPADYPLLHGLLAETVQSAGCRRVVRLFLGDGAASAFVGFGFDGIMLDPLFLAVLTREELRQVFLHELAHLTDSDVRSEIRWRRLAARQAYVRLNMKNGWLQLAAAPVLCATIRFGERLQAYLRTAEPLREREADERAAELGSVRHAAAAVAKAEFVERFREALGKSEHSLAELSGEYAAMIAERGEVWLKELKNEGQCGDGPHEAFGERVRTAQFDPFAREQDENWLCEMDRLCAWADQNGKHR